MDIVIYILIWALIISLIYFFLKEIDLKIELKNKTTVNKIIFAVCFFNLWILEIIKNKIQKGFEERFINNKEEDE